MIVEMMTMMRNRNRGEWTKVGEIAFDCTLRLLSVRDTQRRRKERRGVKREREWDVKGLGYFRNNNVFEGVKRGKEGGDTVKRALLSSTQLARRWLAVWTAGQAAGDKAEWTERRTEGENAEKLPVYGPGCDRGELGEEGRKAEEPRGKGEVRSE